MAGRQGLRIMRNSRAARKRVSPERGSCLVAGKKRAARRRLWDLPAASVKLAVASIRTSA
jgi:hypothetical protein